MPAHKHKPAWLRGLQDVQGVEPQGPYGIRTRAAAVRGRCPRPLDEWAVANAECSGLLASGQGRREPAERAQADADGVGESAVSGSRPSIRSSNRLRISSPVAKRS